MNFSLKTKISTTRLADTRAFYESVFGMVVAEEWDEPGDKGVILAFRDSAGEAYLEIYDSDQIHEFSGLSLQFKVDSLHDFIGALPSGTVREGPKPRPWGATYLYLTDPNGIQVIVYEGGF
ncbi:MAG: VOC family protein [Hyphomonas sp.]|tara:strand:+ start:731 stop:1093 length:363 start_codon:yes stop_codon:yes gene_type:complete